MVVSKNNSSLKLSVIKHFADNKNDILIDSHPKVAAIRQKSINQLSDCDFPTSKDENWRNTNLSALYNANYLIGDAQPAFEKDVSEIFKCSVQGFDTDVYSLLNGWCYSPDNKHVTVYDDGVIVASINAAQKYYPDLLSKYYDEIAGKNDDAFSLINSSVFTDGIFIYVPDNVKVKKAIQLIKMVNNEIDTLVNSRNLIILGKNSELSFLHCDDSIDHNNSFLISNTEIFLSDNSHLELYKLQNLNDNTTLLNNTFVEQKQNSKLVVNVLTFNGGTIRNQINADLVGEGAVANVGGIYLLDKKQHVDNQVLVRHMAPNCNSNQLFKGVLDNSASAVFKGAVYVARDAQKTEAFQKNANILMTSQATIDTMPFLEIYADDVSCSHGATVGQLDNEALFYLMQRGISESDAKLLLMFAFAEEVTSKISIDALKTNIDDMVKKRLRGDLSICDKCVLHCSTPDTPIEFEIDMSKI